VPPPRPIEDRIERAAQLVLRSRVFFDIWLYFEGAYTRPHLLDTMNEFSEFFRIVRSIDRHSSESVLQNQFVLRCLIEVR
jgi:hypothetical protein